MLARAVSALLVLLGVVSGGAWAQTAEGLGKKVDPQDFVRAFLGNRGQYPGQFDRVKASAKAMGFKDLPQNLRPLMAPQDPNAEFAGFFVADGPGSPYLLGVSRSVVDGKTLVACAVANPYIEAAGVVASLDKLAALGKPIQDETGMGQRIRVWDSGKFSNGSFVSLVDAGPMGMGGATLSILAPEVR